MKEEELKRFGILKEHNYLPYEEIDEMFELGESRVGFIQATGTGKAFVAIRWLFDHCLKDPTKRALVLTPRKTIANQFKKYMDELGLTSKYFFDNVDTGTYSGLLALSDEDYDAMDYDYIVLDEFHRIGAKRWGECVEKLLKVNPHVKVLGTTATPIRYLDSQQDMAQKIFGNSLVIGPDVNEAIRTGILPIPKYVTAVYRYDDVIAKLEHAIGKMSDEKRKKVYMHQLRKAQKMAVELGGIDDCFARNITKKDGKFIVFCQDYEHLQEVKDQMQSKLFSKVNDKVKIYEVSYKFSDKQIKEIIDQFNNDSSDALKLMLSIDMFNEGLHLESVDGCILLRPTVSPIVYYQQIGRALATHSNSPLIFDVVNNIVSLHDIAEVFSSDGKGGNGTIQDFIGTLPFKIDDAALPVQSLLYHLQELVSYRTTSSEAYLAAAEEYANKNGNLKVARRYQKNNVKLGKWLAYVRSNYKRDPSSVLPYIAERLTSLDPNVFTYTRENATRERNEKYLEWVRKNQEKNPNQPLPICTRGTGSSEETTFRCLTASIKHSLHNRGMHKYEDDFIKEILKINPRALMTQTEVREERERNFLEWVKQQHQLNPNKPLPTGSGKNLSEQEISFRHQAHAIKKFLSTPEKSLNKYSSSFIEKILEINPDALSFVSDIRNEEYLIWAEKQQAKNPDKPLPTKIAEDDSDTEKTFKRMTGKIKKFVNQPEKARRSFSPEFVDSVLSINPHAFEITAKTKNGDD